MTNAESGLDQRVAIVSGAARGIGLAIAEDLAAAGLREVVAATGAVVHGDVLTSPGSLTRPCEAEKR